MEQVIAEKTDRRAAWEAKMRREGYKRLNVWVRSEKVKAVKEFVAKANDE